MNSIQHTKTKIIATLGPSSASVPMIEKMIHAGLHIVRANMSHGDHTSHTEAIKNARTAAKRTKRPLAILLDLSGPKIRIGDFNTEMVTLEEGNTLILTTEPGVGDVSRVSVNYQKLPSEVMKGTVIYLNDGKQKLVVEKVDANDIYTKILVGGTIRGRRGVNVPDAHLSIATITAKDKKDLAFGLALGVDFVTLSFTRSADDIRQLRKLIGTAHNPMIIAKIETKEAIDNLDAIVAEADALMVARGDLAIEVPPEKVPLLQKQIIRSANKAGKPVITATQMLDSMRASTTPTRAEVNDIANAILDGTDAVMLSDETAVGAHPERAVEVMSNVAREVEQDSFFIDRQSLWDFPPENICDSVCQSIAKTVATTHAKAIVALSESGSTGRMVARYRPRTFILVLTPDKVSFNQSLISYGCIPVLVRRIKNLADARKASQDALIAHNVAELGDTYVLGAGMQFGKPGSTNVMMVEQVGK